MTQLKIGDIVQIRTSKGFAYAQYIHKHPQYGALIRVLPNIYDAPVHDYLQIAEESERFVVFFPLSAAVNKQIVSIVGNAPVPDFAKKFPTFRAGVADPATGKVTTWWLWDGEKEWRVGDLTPEQRKMPIRGIWNDTLLIERIESGWKPETDSA
ncbi:MAG: hypothetical protein A2937_03680 [Candidatus Yonathbacteria bacterium RIFCSPLOWO2_01_FULL_47_33b]|uniref:Uncharacterized protein n=1 Tax=Candidatus Yonathbacteria bacterium RIFCSPLOWO2_01_FULL_47_33b TaxID=1802727 RepID=A0A1G2SEB9_9BACT|nr:MAG: hypothetical protein A2937_03680 [Candidatus Yonathbacteria bacterium RIFCSPLOWO2_01_FULL_47_33b]